MNSEVSSLAYASEAHPVVEVVLEDADLWARFSKVPNEMIVSKTGRLMFPVIKVRVSGLNPSSMYSVQLDFQQIEDNRWKYIGGKWISGGIADSAPQSSVYCHPDSPNFGSFWNSQPISFAKVKLTNHASSPGKILLNSLHKYEPRIQIAQLGFESGENQVVKSVSLPIAQFIAVTAYQNDALTCLKIQHNPFAKGFLLRPSAVNPESRIFGRSHLENAQHSRNESSVGHHFSPVMQRNQQRFMPYSVAPRLGSNLSTMNDQAVVVKEENWTPPPPFATPSGSYPSAPVDLNYQFTSSIVNTISSEAPNMCQYQAVPLYEFNFGPETDLSSGDFSELVEVFTSWPFDPPI